MDPMVMLVYVLTAAGIVAIAAWSVRGLFD
jgi:hypothetical protein